MGEWQPLFASRNARHSIPLGQVLANYALIHKDPIVGTQLAVVNLLEPDDLPISGEMDARIWDVASVRAIDEFPRLFLLVETICRFIEITLAK